jgi:hypothetical protein
MPFLLRNRPIFSNEKRELLKKIEDEEKTRGAKQSNKIYKLGDD